MLVFVIMLISVATAGIGILPTYAAIGVAAPALLILLRILQGFSVGGEAAGAMTFLAEHSPEASADSSPATPRSRPSWPAHRHARGVRDVTVAQRGRDQRRRTGQLGLACAVPRRDPDGHHRWYIRRAISDTPNFEKLKAEGGLSRNPLKEAFATPEHRKAMLLALFIPLMNGSGYYVLFSYMPTFLKGDNIGFSTGTALLVTAASLVAICIAIPFMGALSDRVGRKKVIAGAAIAMAIGAIPCYA